MRIAVCQAPAELAPGSEEWVALAQLARAAAPEVFLLNEMPFGPWIATSERPDPARAGASQHAHRDGLVRLDDLGAEYVLGSQAVADGEQTINEAFVWHAELGITAVHTKQFFPDEAGFYEARWYASGPRHFQLGDVGSLKVGFLICTDVMFSEWARYYGRRGAHLIAVPRATPLGSLERWRTVMRAAAIVSGCYVASSNRVGTQDGVTFGGHGWIIHPSGDVLVETSEREPVVAADVRLEDVQDAQRSYPCYVGDRWPPTAADRPGR